MIRHDIRGAFVYEHEGEQLAAMIYSRTSPTLIVVEHTEVSDVLKGQGMGRQLLDALVAWARETGTKVMATCPYTLAQFRKDETIRDVFAG